MTAALILVAVFLTAVVFYAIGAGVSYQRGYRDGLLDVLDLIADSDEDDGAEAYFKHFGGQIDAGRRREN